MRLINLLCAVACALSLALPGMAQDRSSEHTAKLRMDIAGRQRLLSQRMTAAACFITLGIDREKQLNILTNTLALYSETLDILQFGSTELGLEANQDRALELILKKNRATWQEFETRATSLRDQARAGEILQTATLFALAKQEPDLLSMSQAVVMTLSDMQTKSEADTGATLEVNLAGRQRMLSQAVVKDICLSAAARSQNADFQKYNKRMRTRLALFSETGVALRRGTISASSKPPPPEVFEALVQAHYAWSDLVYLLEPGIADEALNKLDLLEIANGYEALLPRLHGVVKSYVDA
ncbi:hypothetical protein DL1_01835 [Thioclava dalianensis]|uniref:NarX-like N-terminal domain-containing protein n=1 Tax=Thioclava dalianensis TaxID=1185766 RepID=A0A074TI87_9RHOB|nr:type IV pili methyl-accepting chemotaxis transducer N-terminal domain-containing protein [Thioclava dalianensis]KEP69865.1 hypothetical protein DL1_01835 [Thioclava dalianensis]SFM85907.1 Type IV pili methyl-accepting chemotaxis transducer N-term [Thioclava dalianensis]